MAIDLEKYKFLEGLEKDAEFIFEGLKIALLEEIVMVMKAKGINRAELARRLKTSRAYITRMLSADVNFTLMKLVQIAQALGTQLMVDFDIPMTRNERIDKIALEVDYRKEPLLYADITGTKRLPDKVKDEACTYSA